jgi:TPP-dependent pyruvate/acetoin dehydrogenase alpha subunit
MSTQPTTSDSTAGSSPVLEAPLPQDVLHHLYAAMLRARLVGKRLRVPDQSGGAIFAGALQNAGPADVIVSSGANSVLEVLGGAELSQVLRKKNGDEKLAEKKIVVADTSSFADMAAGLAIAALRAASDSVVMAFAAGKSTRGTGFEEAIQFAAKNRLPIVFLADWTGSRQSSRNHDGRELSHWPLATIAVDGRDVIAVYRVTKEAIGAARRGHGPTLVDCVNFLAPGGRGRDERDPLAAYRGYLQRHNAWSELWHSELLTKYKQEIGLASRSGSIRRSATS